VRAGQGGLSYQYNKRIEIPMEVYLTVLISITAMLGLIALGIGLVITLLLHSSKACNLYKNLKPQISPLRSENASTIEFLADFVHVLGKISLIKSTA
jgi:hypothetical protein